MTSHVVRTLASKGLLTRNVDAVDTRARRPVLTAAGLALAPRAIVTVQAVDEALLARLSPTAKRAFTSGLRRLRYS